MHALEILQVAGYKVKCMIAEPKGKRGRMDPGNYDNLLTANQVWHLLPASPTSPSSTSMIMSLVAGVLDLVQEHAEHTD